MPHTTPNAATGAAHSPRALQDFCFLSGSHIRAAAENMPMVVARLASCDQAAYLSAWRAHINPNGSPHALLYGGIGPDVATTPLLLADATTVVGIDRRHFPPHFVEEFTASCRLVESEIAGQGFIDYAPQLAKILGIEWALNNRLSTGYWDNSTINTCALHKLILLDILCAGAEPCSVAACPAANGVTLNFQCAVHRGDPVKDRTVHLIFGVRAEQHIEILAHGPRPLPGSIAGFDSVLFKATSSQVDGSALSRSLRKILTKEGFLACCTSSEVGSMWTSVLNASQWQRWCRELTLADSRALLSPETVDSPWTITRCRTGSVATAGKCEYFGIRGKGLRLGGAPGQLAKAALRNYYSRHAT